MKKNLFITALSLVFFSLSQAQTPVASYPFNGNAADAIGTADGTVNGATLTTDRFGNANSAYNFDGIDDYIIGSAGNYPIGDRTVSLWFNADAGSIALKPGILGYGGGAVCGSSFIMGINNLSSPLKYQLQGHCLSNPNQYAYPAVPETNWYNWVITVSGATSKMYINGVLVSTAATFTTATNVGGKDFIFGNIVNVTGIGSFGLDPGNITYFKGKLDDIQFYNSALSDAQVFDKYVNDLRKPGSGNGLDFPGRLAGGAGSQAYVNIGNGWDSQVFTFESWVRRDVSNQNHALLVSKNDGGWGVGIFGVPVAGPPDRLYLTNVGVNAVYTTATIIGDGKWHHVAVSYDNNAAIGQKVHFYIDGVESTVNDPNYSSTFNSTNGNYYLGGRDHAVESELDGVLDEVRVWENVILTQTQIRDWMTKKLNSSHPAFASLKGYFRLDEGSSTTTRGYNAKFGTLVNTPTWLTSGAALGDDAAHDFVNPTKTANISHASGENFSATETSPGTMLGITVYRVDEQPNTLNGTIGVGANNKYFGVFKSYIDGGPPQVPNGATIPIYTAIYNYNGNPYVYPGNEGNLRLYRRSDNDATLWEQININPVQTENTITVPGENTQYILGSVGAALPVTLLEFKAAKVNTTAKLNWTTTVESEIDHFEIEKSTDGRNFVTLQNVPAAGGSQDNRYQSWDLQPVNGRNYYRLKIISNTGHFMYSQVVMLNFASKITTSIYPNPAVDRIFIYSDHLLVNIQVFDMAGKMVKQFKPANNNQYDISNLPKGIYTLRLSSNDETTIVRLIKL